MPAPREQGWRPSRNSATHLINIASKVDDTHCGGVIMKTKLLVDRELGGLFSGGFCPRVRTPCLARV